VIAGEHGESRQRQQCVERHCAGEAIHAIEHVERIDGANNRDAGECGAAELRKLDQRAAERTAECGDRNVGRRGKHEQRRDQMRRQSRDGRYLEAIVEQAHEHDECRGGQHRGGYERTGGEQTDAEDASDEHREPADDRNVTAMGLATAGFVDQLYGDSDGSEGSHCKQGREKASSRGSIHGNQFDLDLFKILQLIVIPIIRRSATHSCSTLD
jgi:hypothetical protein